VTLKRSGAKVDVIHLLNGFIFFITIDKENEEPSSKKAKAERKLILQTQAENKMKEISSFMDFSVTGFGASSFGKMLGETMDHSQQPMNLPQTQQPMNLPQTQQPMNLPKAQQPMNLPHQPMNLPQPNVQQTACVGCTRLNLELENSKFTFTFNKNVSSFKFHKSLFWKTKEIATKNCSIKFDKL